MRNFASHNFVFTGAPKENIHTLTFRCPQCGGKEFLTAGRAEMKPTDVATCAGCGHEVTASEATELVKKTVQNEMAQIFGDAFKPRA